MKAPARRASTEKQPASVSTEGRPKAVAAPGHGGRERIPSEGVWKEIEGLLKQCPNIKAVRLLAELQRRHPERFEDGLLRTLQRRLKQWRQQHGETPELYPSVS